MPQDEPEGSFEAATAPKPSDAPKEPRIGPKYRLTTLNRLKAAPGQEHTALVEGYLRLKGWITTSQTVIDFPLEQLPRNPDEFQALTEAIQRFEVTQRQETTQ